MRFRKKRRRPLHARRAAGMKGDWIVLAHSTCPNVGSPFDACAEPVVDHLNSLSLIDTTDIQAKQDSLTIVRMVGEMATVYMPRLTPVTSGVVDPSSWLIQLDEAIYVATDDPTTGDVQIMDPRLDATMESDQVMWRRRTLINFTMNGVSVASAIAGVDYETQEAFSSHLDIRVKRRLSQGQSLIYTSGVLLTAQEGNPWSLALLNSISGPPLIHANLRGYVKF